MTFRSFLAAGLGLLTILGTNARAQGAARMGSLQLGDELAHIGSRKLSALTSLRNDWRQHVLEISRNVDSGLVDDGAGASA